MVSAVVGGWWLVVGKDRFSHLVVGGWWLGKTGLFVRAVYGRVIGFARRCGVVPQLPTINHQPRPIVRQPPTTNHQPPTTVRLLFILLLSTLINAADLGVAGDSIEADEWFIGQLNGQPAVSLHQSALRLGRGGRTTSADMVMVFKRKLDRQESRFEVRQSQRQVEGADGALVSFRLDEEQNGAPVSAVGAISGGRVRGVLHRLGRADEFDLMIPEGLTVVADRRGLELMGAAEGQVGEVVRFATVGLVANQVLVMINTATAQGREANGASRFSVAVEHVPGPMTVVVNRKGVLRRMALDLGAIKLELTPSAGPVALLGAELATTGLVAIAGPSPRPAPINRYQLPEGATVSEDGFQSRLGDVLTVRKNAEPEPLPDPAAWLAAGPQLEIDDPGLRQWVADLVSGAPADPLERAEHLGLAVRSYITIKDLSVNDGSALETWRSRRGDCTEHATLLCAALRIAGLPARVDVGLVFYAEYGGWVGHAWNSVWIGDRWHHLDSALPNSARSLYIRLGSPTGTVLGSTGAALMSNLSTVMGKRITVLPPE